MLFFILTCEVGNVFPNQRILHRFCCCQACMWHIRKGLTSSRNLPLKFRRALRVGALSLILTLPPSASPEL